jgi:hypothetical protein
VLDHEADLLLFPLYCLRRPTILVLDYLHPPLLVLAHGSDLGRLLVLVHELVMDEILSHCELHLLVPALEHRRPQWELLAVGSVLLLASHHQLRGFRNSKQRSAHHAEESLLRAAAGTPATTPQYSLDASTPRQYTPPTTPQTPLTHYTLLAAYGINTHGAG